jgi:hypothetical protein
VYNPLPATGTPGVTGPVYTMCVRAGDVIVGGDFSGAPSATLGNIGVWNPSTELWSAVTSLNNDRGLPATVAAITVVDNRRIAVAGAFSIGGGLDAGGLLLYDFGTGEWYQVRTDAANPARWNSVGPPASPFSIKALSVANGTQLLVGGDFDAVNSPRLAAAGNVAAFYLPAPAPMFRRRRLRNGQ